MQTGTSDVAFARRYDLELRMPSEKDHDYADIPNVTELLEYKQTAISYIAGFVVKMVQNRIRCPECVGALAVSRNTHSYIPLVFFKDRGGSPIARGSLNLYWKRNVVPANVENNFG